MSGNTLVKRWTKLLHNIWRHSFPIVETTFFQRWKAPYLTFDSTLIQRLTTPLSNVWQYSSLTLDNTFIQRSTKTLSAVWKCLKIIFVYFVWISIMIIGKSMCGRSVVENTDFGAIDHSIKMLSHSRLHHICGRVVEIFRKLIFFISFCKFPVFSYLCHKPITKCNEQSDTIL